MNAPSPKVSRATLSMQSAGQSGTSPSSGASHLNDRPVYPTYRSLVIREPAIRELLSLAGASWHWADCIIDDGHISRQVHSSKVGRGKNLRRGGSGWS